MTVEPTERVNGTSAKQASPDQSGLLPSTLDGVCPFFGLADDPQTRLLFASPGGCCHRVEPVAHVSIEHQQTTCLTGSHILCPVFKRPEWDTLPPDLAYHDPVSRSRRFWPWLVGLAAIALLLGLLWLGGGGFGNRTDLESTPEAGLAAGLSLSTKTVTPMPTKTAVPSPTNQPVQPTDTMTPTATATAKPSATPTSMPTATLVPTYTPVLPTETAVPHLLGAVVVDRLNVRSGPGIGYDLLATVDEGEQFELTGRLRNSSWWQICCINGEPGWIIAEAIEIPEGAETAVAIVPISALPATPTPEN